jgi:hypothetical protein
MGGAIQRQGQRVAATISHIVSVRGGFPHPCAGETDIERFADRPNYDGTLASLAGDGVSDARGMADPREP